MNDTNLTPSWERKRSRIRLCCTRRANSELLRLGLMRIRVRMTPQVILGCLCQTIELLPKLVNVLTKRAECLFQTGDLNIHDVKFVTR